MRALLFAFVVAAAQAQQFDGISVKPSDPSSRGSSMRTSPGGVEMHNYSLKSLVTSAFDLTSFQVDGGPRWLESTTFDVVAKYPAGADRKDMPKMMQTMLAERFKLVFHRESRTVREYALVVGKDGPKLQEASADDKAHAGMSAGPGNLKLSGYTMATLARALIGQVQAPVIDRTGLAGQYTLTLKFAPFLNGVASDDSLPDIFGAISQLGLKLEPTKGDMEVLVIDSAAMPAEN